MRRLLVALAVAGLVASGTGAAAQASSFEQAAPVPSAVLTPDQLGISHPAQGFYPFFQSAGQAGGIGLGGLANTSSGATLFTGRGGCGVFSTSFCPFFTASPFSQTFVSQNGGTIGLGNQFGTGGQGGQGGFGGLFGLGGFGNGGFGQGNSLFGLGGFGVNNGGFGTGFGTGLGSGFGTGFGGTVVVGPGGQLFLVQ